jgi:putative hydrolase
MPQRGYGFDHKGVPPMIRNDLHVHSIRSLCGVHTVMEIVEIAARKGMRSVNICDHGKASGKEIKFNVINDKQRFPRNIQSAQGVTISITTGIEANILDLDGNSDFPLDQACEFDLVSAGFHSMARELSSGKSRQSNTQALENYLKRFPLDILTHPCIATFPLDTEALVDLSIEYGFALEVNNTNLRLKKTDVDRLKDMIDLAVTKGALVSEDSDGHTLDEIGENEQIAKLLKTIGRNGDDVFFNRNDELLDQFIEKRQAIRGCRYPSG